MRVPSELVLFNAHLFRDATLFLYPHMHAMLTNITHTYTHAHNVTHIYAHILTNITHTYMHTMLHTPMHTMSHTPMHTYTQYHTHLCTHTYAHIHTSYVLPNHMLFQIAEILPREPQGVLACCNPIPTLIRQELNEIFRLVQLAREQPADKVRMTQ